MGVWHRLKVEHGVSVEQGGPWPKGRGAMRCFRNRPGAAGTMAPGDVLTTHRDQEELLTLHLLKEHSHKRNYINILICWNRTKYVLLRRKKLLL